LIKLHREQAAHQGGKKLIGSPAGLTVKQDLSPPILEPHASPTPEKEGFAMPGRSLDQHGGHNRLFAPVAVTAQNGFRGARLVVGQTFRQNRLRNGAYLRTLQGQPMVSCSVPEGNLEISKPSRPGNWGEQRDRQWDVVARRDGPFVAPTEQPVSPTCRAGQRYLHLLGFVQQASIDRNG